MEETGGCSEMTKVAILDAHLEAVRNLALVAEGTESEAMCAELRDLEMDWRRSLAETEEQREAAPILVEFATASSAIPNIIQLDTNPV